MRVTGRQRGRRSAVLQLRDMDDASVECVVRFLVTCGRDDELHLPGVGWLSARHYKPYEGRDPRTGALISVPEKCLPFFRVDPELHRAINVREELATSD